MSEKAAIDFGIEAVQRSSFEKRLANYFLLVGRAGCEIAAAKEELKRRRAG
jgi:hypothetical protein